MERLALPLCLIGVIIAVLPLILLGSPGNGGPVGFAVGMMKTIMILLGAGVVGIGFHSYRSDDIILAIRAYVTIFLISGFALAGALIETSGGPLVPIWAWVLVVGFSVTLSVVSSNWVRAMFDETADG